MDSAVRVGHRHLVEAAIGTRAASGLAFLLAIAAAAGCAHRGPPPVARVVGGTVREGAFVSPYEYEWFTRGELAASEGRNQEALDALEKATLGAAEDPYVLSRVAELRADRDEAGAARLLARAEELDPRSEAAALARGHIAQAHGRLPEAVASYREALDRAPTSPTSLEALARALVASDASSEAAALLAEHTIESLPLARLRFDLAVRLGDASAAEATAARLATTYAPGESDVRRSIAAAIERGDFSLAARLLDALPEPTRRDRAERVLCLARSGHVADAELALASEGAFEDPIDRAETALALGTPAEALASLDSILATVRDPRAMRLRGEALLELGRIDEGIAALRSVPRFTSERRLALASLADRLRAAGRIREADEAAAELAE